VRRPRGEKMYMKISIRPLRLRRKRRIDYSR